MSLFGKIASMCGQSLRRTQTDKSSNYSIQPWNSLVENDEKLDWPNSQTNMELCCAWVAHFWGG